jgi:hypothetical protein
VASSREEVPTASSSVQNNVSKVMENRKTTIKY